jgi:hypothetical protein
LMRLLMSLSRDSETRVLHSTAVVHSWLSATMAT